MFRWVFVLSSRPSSEVDKALEDIATVQLKGGAGYDDSSHLIPGPLVISCQSYEAPNEDLM